MNKVVFHKNCRQHIAVANVKKMLDKMIKKYKNKSGNFCHLYFSLTGINELDREAIQSCVKNQLEKLKSEIEQELEKNSKLDRKGNWNEKYEEGFCLSPVKKQLELTDELVKIHTYIWLEYPDIEKKTSERFIFSANDIEEKYEEAKRHFEDNPVNGYCCEWFKVLPDGKIEKLFPIVFSSSCLHNAQALYVEYL